MELPIDGTFSANVFLAELLDKKDEWRKAATNNGAVRQLCADMAGRTKYSALVTMTARGKDVHDEAYVDRCHATADALEASLQTAVLKVGLTKCGIRFHDASVAGHEDECSFEISMPERSRDKLHEYYKAFAVAKPALVPA